MASFYHYQEKMHQCLDLSKAVSGDLSQCSAHVEKDNLIVHPELKERRRANLSSLGTFNNYVDQIKPNFDHPIPIGGQLWAFYIQPTLCSHDQGWTFY